MFCIAIGPAATWGGTAQSVTTKVAGAAATTCRALAGQTLRMWRQSGETLEDLVRRRVQQVQVYSDSQDRRGFGEQAFFNYASYMGHIAGHDNSWTMTMLNLWQPDYDETARLLRSRTYRNAHNHYGSKNT